MQDIKLNFSGKVILAEDLLVIEWHWLSKYSSVK
jgi:hypothetical protein